MSEETYDHRAEDGRDPLTGGPGERQELRRLDWSQDLICQIAAARGALEGVALSLAPKDPNRRTLAKVAKVLGDVGDDLLRERYGK